MAIILNNNIEGNKYFSELLDEELNDIYIVIDEIYINKNKSECRVQLDYYKSKNTRLKGVGLLKTENIYPEDITAFISNSNIYESAYILSLAYLNNDIKDKFIGDQL